MARYGGRFNSAINYFYKKSPLGIVMMENAKRKDDFNQWSKTKDKSWKEFFDELVKEPEFAEIVKQKVQEELKKERANSRAKRIAKVRGIFKAAKDKFRKEGGGTYGTIIPPHIMETVLEAMELAYEAGEAVAKIISDAVNSISEKLGTDTWDKDKFTKEWEEKLGDKASAEEAYKQRLRDQIKELDEQIADKKRKYKPKTAKDRDWETYLYPKYLYPTFH